MPTRSALTDRAVRNARPQDRPYKLADGGGLHLLVETTGRRVWRLKYRLLGKEKLYTIGSYPEVGLADARAARDRARALVAEGRDPVAERRRAGGDGSVPSELTFRQLFERWHALMTVDHTQRHRDQILDTIERYVMPRLGRRPAVEILPPEGLEVLREIEALGYHETAHRCRMWASLAYRWGIASGALALDPFEQLKGALRPRKGSHFKALPVEDMPAFLARLERDSGDPLTRMGLLFTVLTWVRTNEARFARWTEFDLDRRLWSIPEDRMKKRRDHLVPLAGDVVELLEEVRKLSGRSEWVFPQVRNPRKPMSENAMLYALYRMGYHDRATVHGFRAVASTVCNEASPFDEVVIERQLAHVEGDKTRAAYNRAQYLDDRRRLMEWWAAWIREQRGV